MERSSKRPVKVKIRPEIFIMIIIIICVSFIMHFDQHERMQGVVSINEDGTMVILHDEEDVAEYQSQGRTIVEYQPDTCRLIEVYDVQLERVFRMVFLGNNDDYKIIDNNSEIREMYRTMDSGHTTVDIENDSLDVYFQWEDIEEDSRYLIVYVSSKRVERSLLVFNLVCYITIILCFVMLTNSIYWQCRGVSNRYRQIRKEMAQKIFD